VAQDPEGSSGQGGDHGQHGLIIGDEQIQPDWKQDAAWCGDQALDLREPAPLAARKETRNPLRKLRCWRER
jgi:hypothetical protein